MAGGPTLRLPGPGGALTRHTLSAPGAWDRSAQPSASRTAYAAAHVVADPFADTAPGAEATLDWDATLAFRRHLWAHGLGVADAMDTAQRGMGLTWGTTTELIRRSAAEARAVGGMLACGAGTDHAPPALPDLDAVAEAYGEQVAVVEEAGATVVLMASRQLAALARHADDYATIYQGVLTQTRAPVILHWLGPSFDPALTGYWGSADLDQAVDHVLALIRAHPDRIDGVKVSLLEARHEVRLRRQVPAGVKVYTGDDFSYCDLIAGDEHGHSDALLGIFDPVAPAAAAALRALDSGDDAGYRALLEPTVPLARHLFAAPTFHYKTGITFLAWLAGHQEAFAMVGGLASARSLTHLVEAFRLADAAGLLPDPELAADRMRKLLAVAGVEA